VSYVRKVGQHAICSYNVLNNVFNEREIALVEFVETLGIFVQFNLVFFFSKRIIISGEVCDLRRATISVVLFRSHLLCVLEQVCFIKKIFLLAELLVAFILEEKAVFCHF
jgi:hypothetical protein